MDPGRPPQHPFSRTGSSPYPRNPPYAQAGQPYPPSSHAPNTTSSYPEQYVECQELLNFPNSALTSSYAPSRILMTVTDLYTVATEDHQNLLIRAMASTEHIVVRIR